MASNKFEESITRHIIEKADFAGNISDGSLNFFTFFSAVMSANCAAAVLRMQESHQVADGRGFSGTVGTEKSECFSFFDFERKIENTFSVAVIARQIFDKDILHRFLPILPVDKNTRGDCRGYSFYLVVTLNSAERLPIVTFALTVAPDFSEAFTFTKTASPGCTSPGLSVYPET